MDFEEIVQRVAAPDNPKIRKKTRLALDGQQHLFIEHKIEGGIVLQRPHDGYVNVTSLCQKAGKRFGTYYQNQQTKAFIQALSLDVGIPTSNLVQITRGRGDRLEQGTWVHPQVAIHVAQWLSPEFSVQVTKWVFDWMSGIVKSYMPDHVKRFIKNRKKIPYDSFSMLNETYLNLHAPLEECGVVLPDNVMVDISTGLGFCKYLRKRGVDTEALPTYDHEFVDRSRPIVQAKLYPIEYLPAYREYINNDWIPNRSRKYFEDRCPEAVPYLDRITALPAPQRERQLRPRITRKQARRSLPATRS